MKKSAKELAIELENILIEIQEAYKESELESIRLGSLRQDILHHMENDKFNANQGYKYAKALQMISQERRVVKNEHRILQSLMSKINPIKDKMIGAAKSIKDRYDEECDLEKGYEKYQYRVIKGIDKNDIVNQVMEVLHKED